MKKVISIVFIAILTLKSVPCFALIPVIDVANYSQNIFTAIRTLQSNINEARSIANQIKNLKSLPENIIGEFELQLSDLFSTMGSINGLMQDITSLQSRFEELYPEFHQSSSLVPRMELAEESTKLIKHTREMMLGVAKTGAQVLGNLPKAKSELAGLMHNSQGAVGILQATQAVNQISGIISENLMELNAQIASYTQAHSAFLMEINQSTSATKNRMGHVLEGWDKPYAKKPINENPF